MNLKELQDKWAIEAEIPEHDLSGASRKTSNLHSQWINEAISAKLLLVKLQMDIAALQVLRGRYFRGEMSSAELKNSGWDQWQFKTLRSDIADMIIGSPDMQKLLGRQEYLKIMLYFIESVLTEIKARSFHIKNSLDFLRFRAGD